MLLLLLAVDIVAGSFTERWCDARRGASLRNPLFRRDWPHFVKQAEPAREGERLIVVISNSQGYGREFYDHETYAALLQKTLRLREPTRVLNWSIGGGVGPEFTLLAAAAHRLRPDRVVVVSPASAFREIFWQDETGRGRLTRRASDLWKLAAYPEIRGHLPDAYRRHYLPLPISLDALLARTFRILDRRDLVVWALYPRSWKAPFGRRPLAQVWGTSLHLSVEPTHAADPRRQQSAGKKRRRRLARSLEVQPPASPLRLELLDHLLETLPAESDPVFVLMPSYSRSRLKYEDFPAAARARARATGVDFLDLQSAIPNHDFRSTAHFNRRGHRRMARILAHYLSP